MGQTYSAPPAPVSLATLNSAASTNATVIKGSPGSLHSLVLSNNGGAAAFAKLYNKATAPTVGTDVPVLVIPIPAAGIASLDLTQGVAFSLGIGLAITNLIADADATAVAAGQVKVMAGYL
jgi:hypothetical protein